MAIEINVNFVSCSFQRQERHFVEALIHLEGLRWFRFASQGDVSFYFSDAAGGRVYEEGERLPRRRPRTVVQIKDLWRQDHGIKCKWLQDHGMKDLSRQGHGIKYLWIQGLGMNDL